MAQAFHEKSAIAVGVEKREVSRNISFEAHRIFHEQGASAANAFLTVARGGGTPFLPLVDRWLSERLSIKPRQKRDYKRAVEKFALFCPVLEEVMRLKASEYVSEKFYYAGVHPRTTNKDISCLSSFWRWLKRRGFCEGENPWREQGVNQRDLEAVMTTKRPYTDDEMRTLLGGISKHSMLGDAVWIAALSGMRVSEIAKLTVADLEDGSFVIRGAKTASGNRLVPIHDDLQEIVSHRVKGKKRDDRLFAELPHHTSDDVIEPGQAITKHFNRLRKRLGVDERQEGSRQSNVDFHSFRRWFITQAEIARQPPHIISAVVGHKRPGMTLGTYSGGPSVEQLRECVNAVRLPKRQRPTRDS